VSDTLHQIMTRSAQLHAAKKRARSVNAGKASARGSRTRGKALEAAKAEIAAYLARVPESL
jgi:hypothetical protein